MPASALQHNDTLEWRWETLFSRSMARLPGERKEASRDGDYLLGIKRLRRLYCNVGIGFHIQVLPDGRIHGIHNENRYSKLRRLPRLATLSCSRSPTLSVSGASAEPP